MKDDISTTSFLFDELSTPATRAFEERLAADAELASTTDATRRVVDDLTLGRDSSRHDVPAMVDGPWDAQPARSWWLPGLLAAAAATVVVAIAAGGSDTPDQARSTRGALGPNHVLVAESGGPAATPTTGAAPMVADDTGRPGVSVRHAPVATDAGRVILPRTGRSTNGISSFAIDGVNIAPGVRVVEVAGGEHQLTVTCASGNVMNVPVSVTVGQDNDVEVSCKSHDKVAAADPFAGKGFVYVGRGLGPNVYVGIPNNRIGGPTPWQKVVPTGTYPLFAGQRGKEEVGAVTIVEGELTVLGQKRPSPYGSIERNPPSKKPPTASPAEPNEGAHATGATGRVIVNARPWAKITVDGEPYGTTPKQLELPAGEHTIKLTKGGRTTSKSVRVEAGKRTRVSHDFTN